MSSQHWASPLSVVPCWSPPPATPSRTSTRSRRGSTSSTTRPRRLPSATTRRARSCKATQTRLSSLRADLDRQQAKVESVREQVATAVVSQYQGQALSSTSQVVPLRGPRRVPRPAHHGVGLQRPAEPDDGRLRHPGEAARAARGRREAGARRGRRDQEEARRREGRDRREGRRRQGAAQRPRGRGRGGGSRRRPCPGRQPQRGPRPGSRARRRRLRSRRCRRLLRAGPGRRRLRVRRGRPGRLRLLRPHDDGVGAGRREPPALVQRPDELRHPGLLLRARSPATWSSTTAR